MDVGLCGKVYTFKPPIIIAASFTIWERSGDDHLHLDEGKNLDLILSMIMMVLLAKMRTVMILMVMLTIVRGVMIFHR